MLFENKKCEKVIYSPFSFASDSILHSAAIEVLSYIFHAAFFFSSILWEVPLL